jgi:hypothetical protein
MTLVQTSGAQSGNSARLDVAKCSKLMIISYIYVDDIHFEWSMPVSTEYVVDQHRSQTAQAIDFPCEHLEQCDRLVMKVSFLE